MKPNELRIGNYCQTDKGYLLQVNALSENGIDFHLVDREKYPIKETWQAEFIPLTEEWLEKFGFELYDFDLFDEDVEGIEEDLYLAYKIKPKGKKYTYNVDLHKPDGFCSFNIQLRWIESEISLTSIQYVHQLQNLYFALTGEELEITKQ